MNAVSRYSPVVATNRLRAQSRPIASGGSHSSDRVTLSGASEKRDIKKMALFGGLGSALGAAAVALLCPAAGLGALILGGLLSGAAGAAIADGALETAGTGKPQKFDPYNPSDVLDPNNLYHPRNPYNPNNFG